MLHLVTCTRISFVHRSIWLRTPMPPMLLLLPTADARRLPTATIRMTNKKNISPNTTQSAQIPTFDQIISSNDPQMASPLTGFENTFDPSSPMDKNTQNSSHPNYLKASVNSSGNHHFFKNYQDYL